MITAVISVLSTLAGALIGFWGTMKTSRSHLFYASASNLKHSFLEVLVLLRQPKETFIDLYVIEIMEKSFYKHEMAVSNSGILFRRPNVIVSTMLGKTITKATAPEKTN